MTHYRKIPNIHGVYVAGSDGNIYSTRGVNYKKLSAGKCSNNNYLQVNLLTEDLKRSSVMVHVAVCGAWNGKKPDHSYQVRHLDGNSFNNLPENLAWSSVKDNMSDKIIHGTDDNGLKNSRAKLSKEKLYQANKHLKTSPKTSVEDLKELIQATQDLLMDYSIENQKNALYVLQVIKRGMKGA
jgi:hypothetical protein